MKRSSDSFGLVAGGSHRAGMRQAALLRYLILAVVAGLAAGCADDVVLRNPQTGMIETCRESMRGFDPWSHKMACVANHEAQGWTLVSGE